MRLTSVASSIKRVGQQGHVPSTSPRSEREGTGSVAFNTMEVGWTMKGSCALCQVLEWCQ